MHATNNVLLSYSQFCTMCNKYLNSQLTAGLESLPLRSKKICGPAVGVTPRGLRSNRITPRTNRTLECLGDPDCR